jgi:hypothetical protein
MGRRLGIEHEGRFTKPRQGSMRGGKIVLTDKSGSFLGDIGYSAISKAYQKFSANLGKDRGLG